MSISIRKTSVTPSKLEPGLNKDVIIKFEGKSDTSDVTVDFTISQDPDYVFNPTNQSEDYSFTNSFKTFTKTVDIERSNTTDNGLIELNATEKSTGSVDSDNVPVH